MAVPPQAFRLVLSALSVTALGTTVMGGSVGAQPAAGPRLVQPGAPGEPTRPITAAEAADTSGVTHTAADVAFMRDMIAHHAQALEMTAAARERASSDDLRTLALRIEVSQADEMAMMRAWLTQRGETLPDSHAHHGHDAPLMPGMLTPEEMAALLASRGPLFDRLFLTGMIKHHEGALAMVRTLFATPGAGQEPALFAFASDVEADQSMEIRRMRALLKEIAE